MTSPTTAPVAPDTDGIASTDKSYRTLTLTIRQLNGLGSRAIGFDNLRVYGDPVHSLAATPTTAPTTKPATQGTTKPLVSEATNAPTASSNTSPPLAQTTAPSPTLVGDSSDSYSAWTGLAGLSSSDVAKLDDPDGDGHSNFEEYALGLDPTAVNPASAARLTASTSPIISIKMAHRLGLRCVLLSDPSTDKCCGPNQTMFRIQIL